MIKHLDSSIFIDFEYEDGDIDSSYNAEWYVKQQGAIVAKGDLELDGQYFKMRIQTGDLANLKAGQYTLAVAVICLNIGYKEYIYEETLTLKQ